MKSKFVFINLIFIFCDMLTVISSSHQYTKDFGIQGSFNTTMNPNRTQDYQHFLHYWRLHHAMRFDFQRIMEPCENKTKWIPYYFQRTPFLITSANLSGVELDIKPAGQYSRIIIKSYSLMNTRKKTGGDSWRVLIKGVRSVTPVTIDNMDGTYEASFLLTEPGYYHVILSLEYTLCDGFKDPPPRWFNRGDEQGKNQPPDSLPGYEKAYLEEEYKTIPLEFSVYRNEFSIYEELKSQLEGLQYSSCLMWDGFGEWTNTADWIPTLSEPFMKKTAKQRKNNDGTLWLYGDSVTRRFYQDTVNTSQLCNGIFKKCDHVVNKIYNTRPGKASRDSKDLNLTRIESELESALREPTLMNNANSAILVNYGLHFVMDTPFSVFIDVMETVTRTLQKWKHLMKGTIIWRSINAMNKWKYGWPDNLKKHDKEQRFLTEPRVELFNAYSTWRMCQSKIKTLDIFPMTYSYPFGTGTLERPHNDSVHYVHETFWPMEKYLIDFFNATTNNDLN